jgi:hypothetical protein
MDKADTRTIHLTDGDGPPLCAIPAGDAETLALADWETGVDAGLGSRVCRDCADAARRARAE